MDKILLRDVSGVRLSVLSFQLYIFAKNIPFHFIPKVFTQMDYPTRCVFEKW